MPAGACAEKAECRSRRRSVEQRAGSEKGKGSGFLSLFACCGAEPAVRRDRDQPKVVIEKANSAPVPEPIKLPEECPPLKPQLSITCPSSPSPSPMSIALSPFSQAQVHRASLLASGKLDSTSCPASPSFSSRSNAHLSSVQPSLSPSGHHSIGRAASHHAPQICPASSAPSPASLLSLPVPLCKQWSDDRDTSRSSPCNVLSAVPDDEQFEDRESPIMKPAPAGGAASFAHPKSSTRLSKLTTPGGDSLQQHNPPASPSGAERRGRTSRRSNSMRMKEKLPSIKHLQEKADHLYWHSKGEDFFTNSGNLKSGLVRGASIEGDRIESPTRMSPYMKNEFYRQSSPGPQSLIHSHRASTTNGGSPVPGGSPIPGCSPRGSLAGTGFLGHHNTCSTGNLQDLPLPTLPLPHANSRGSLETSRSSPAPFYDMVFSKPCNSSTPKPCASLDGKYARSMPSLDAQNKAGSAGPHKKPLKDRDPLAEGHRTSIRGGSFKSAKSTRSVRLGGETVLGADDWEDSQGGEALNPCLVCSAIRGVPSMHCCDVDPGLHAMEHVRLAASMAGVPDSCAADLDR